MEYITRENITLLIALIGAIGTISGIVSKRTNINLKIIDYVHIKTHKNIVQLFLLIENRSSNPIIISSISISYLKGKKYYCELLPKIITENKLNKVFTPNFPINLQAYQGYQGYFEFLYCEDISLVEGKNLDIQIYTNRKVINKSLTLHSKSHYLPPIS